MRYLSELMKPLKLQPMRLRLWVLRVGSLVCLVEVVEKKSAIIATIQNVTLPTLNLAQLITISIVILITKKSVTLITIKSVTRCIRMCVTLCMILSAIQHMGKSVIQITRRFVIIMDMEDTGMITMDIIADLQIMDTVMGVMDTIILNVIRSHMKCAIAIQRSIAQSIQEKYAINIPTKSANQFRSRNVTSIQSSTAAPIQFTNAMKFHIKFAIR